MNINDVIKAKTKFYIKLPEQQKHIIKQFMCTNKQQKYEYK